MKTTLRTLRNAHAFLKSSPVLARLQPSSVNMAVEPRLDSRIRVMSKNLIICEMSKNEATQLVVITAFKLRNGHRRLRGVDDGDDGYTYVRPLSVKR